MEKPFLSHLNPYIHTKPNGWHWKMKMAQTTKDGHRHVDTSFGKAAGPIGSILLTDITADKVGAGSKLKGRTLDDRRLRPVKASRMQVGNGPIERTSTQTTMVIP